MQYATNTPATRLADFQNAATGLPSRTESTEAREIAARPLSHSTGRWNGTPDMLSAVTVTLCQRTTDPWRHTWTCWRGASGPGRLG